MTNHLWGRPTSANVQKILWAADELGLPFEHHIVGGKYGGNDTADYKAMHPFGRVPVWQEGDLTLFESNAILRHFDRVHGPLLPTDPAARVEADMWMEFAVQNFVPAIGALFGASFRTAPASQNPAAIAAATAETNTTSAILEARLANSEWLGGDSFSMADIATGVWMHRYWTIPFDRADRPNLARWTDTLRSRPAFSRVVETSFEELRGDRP